MSATAWTDLEREYSPSSMVPSLRDLLHRYAAESARVRCALPYSTHAYGPDASETLDVFSAGAGSPVHVFVHGGYWQELSKDDSSFPAAGFVRDGTTYVAINYGLAPQFRLDQIVDQVSRAVRWVAQHGDVLGTDSRQLVLSGSSAGAHLAAAATLQERRQGAGTVAPAVRGLILMSGVFDLVPLVDTYVNDALGLDAESASALSPLRMLDVEGPLPPMLAGWGEHETAAFKQQSVAFANAWRDRGGTACATEIRGRNHFDIVHDLSEPSSQFGELVRTSMKD